MLYPFMTLCNETEIVHSEMRKDGTVKVVIETPDELLGFKHAECLLPEEKWYEISGYNEHEISYLKELINSEKHLILEFAVTGGFDNASGF